MYSSRARIEYTHLHTLPSGAHPCPFHLLTTFPSVQFPEAGPRQGLAKWELRQVLRRVKDLSKQRLEKKEAGDFPAGPVVKTPHFHCRRHGSNSW